MISKSEVINHGVKSVGKRPEDENGHFEPQIQQIAIDRLVVPISHPRKSPKDLESLQQSIRRDGLQEPLLVCRSDDELYMYKRDGHEIITFFAKSDL